MEWAFKEGIWSPETMVFILHLSVVFRAGILLLSFENSLPKISMNLRHYLVLRMAAVLAAVLVGIGLVGCETPESNDVDTTEAPKAVDVGGSYNKDGVAPFGMVQRLPKQLDDAAASAADNAVSGSAATLADQNALFEVHCTACHGRDGLGVEPLGVTLVGSPFIMQSSNEQLIAMLKVGRLPDSPDSVKGRVMPGFAWMTDEQLTEIAAFLKTQNP
jgi:mono/diheme cytochrome c family protein